MIAHLVVRGPTEGDPTTQGSGRASIRGSIQAWTMHRRPCGAGLASAQSRGLQASRRAIHADDDPAHLASVVVDDARSRRAFVVLLDEGREDVRERRPAVVGEAVGRMPNSDWMSMSRARSIGVPVTTTSHGVALMVSSARRAVRRRSPSQAGGADARVALERRRDRADARRPGVDQVPRPRRAATVPPRTASRRA